MKHQALKQLFIGSLLSLTATIPVNPATPSLPNASSDKAQVKEMTSADLKAAIGYAMQKGDLDAKDGKELIDKITDIETLMDQFDFIRDQEHRMVSSVGSSFH